MSEPAEAVVVHRMPGRLRLRLPARRGDDAFFARVAERLRETGDCDKIVANPCTGSLLIKGKVVQRIDEAAQGLLRIRPPDGEAVARVAAGGWHRLDGGIRRMTGGLLGGRGVLFLGFVGLGVLQMSRGHIAGPATTMFWYAADIARRAIAKP